MCSELDSATYDYSLYTIIGMSMGVTNYIIINDFIGQCYCTYMYMLVIIYQ